VVARRVLLLDPVIPHLLASGRVVGERRGDDGGSEDAHGIVSWNQFACQVLRGWI
jgi:hypothetical protein